MTFFLQFFRASLNFAKVMGIVVKSTLCRNNKAKTLHAIQILPTTTTCDQTSGSLHRPIAKILREPTGVRLSCHRKCFCKSYATRIYPSLLQCTSSACCESNCLKRRSHHSKQLQAKPPGLANQLAKEQESRTTIMQSHSSFKRLFK
jgi:hypothetical protein